MLVQFGLCNAKLQHKFSTHTHTHIFIYIYIYIQIHVFTHMYILLCFGRVTRYFKCVTPKSTGRV